MYPPSPTKLLALVSLLNLLPISFFQVYGQWHYPSPHNESPLQQQSQLIKSHLKKALEPFIPPVATAPPPPKLPPPPPPPPPNKRAAIISPPPQITLYTTPAPTTEPTAPRCGESLNATKSGISHTPFQQIMEQERCVWTIVVPGATGYHIDILYIGWDPKNNNKDGISNHLLINGFKRSKMSTELLITGKGVHTIIDASMLVVTFISGTNPDNSTQGFILQYVTVLTGVMPPVSASSLHQLILPETSHLKHPAAANGLYANNELSSFIFIPENNVHTADQKVNLVYIKVGMEEPKCDDYVDVYGLNVTSNAHAGLAGNNAKWDFKGRICGVLTTQLIDNTDLLMMVFQTDGKGQSTGFQLTHTVC